MDWFHVLFYPLSPFPTTSSFSHNFLLKYAKYAFGLNKWIFVKENHGVVASMKTGSVT